MDAVLTISQLVVSIIGIWFRPLRLESMLDEIVQVRDVQLKDAHIYEVDEPLIFLLGLTYA